MKAKIKKVKEKTFVPFKLILCVETQEELNSLLNRFYLENDDIYNAIPMYYKNVDNDDETMDMIYEILTEYDILGETDD